MEEHLLLFLFLVKKMVISCQVLKFSHWQSPVTHLPHWFSALVSSKVNLLALSWKSAFSFLLYPFSHLPPLIHQLITLTWFKISTHCLHQEAFTRSCSLPCFVPRLTSWYHLMPTCGLVSGSYHFTCRLSIRIFWFFH